MPANPFSFYYPDLLQGRSLPGTLASASAAGPVVRRSRTGQVYNSMAGAPSYFAPGSSSYNMNMGGGGGGGGDLASAYQSAYSAARAANETRYRDILKEGEGMGAQEGRDIAARWRGVYGSGMQNLVSRGLSGTTIGANLQAGAARGESADQGWLQERLRNWRLGFMERRTDEYPDYGQLERLSQGMGRYGGGGGSVYGGGQTGFFGQSPAMVSTTPMRAWGQEGVARPGVAPIGGEEPYYPTRRYSDRLRPRGGQGSYVIAPQRYSGEDRTSISRPPTN